MISNEETMLKIENVSKIYKFGEIGGTTLRETLQRARAKILKKEDPTKKVGAKNYNRGEKFKALDNVSFEVKKGERIGIIGHNGAGKSTLLKLISRVTGPSSGTIYLNGRVASMLEVGTGFHPELTGRENIYMNGAILGMTKKEIDEKIEDIIDFSEVRQFIDTPVKRYSSGMYVKLAFSVAAHLNSEIMIMDEVLAVGDMAFQNKCLSKMKNISEEDGRTILYVSHNMNTIRQLCNRVVVLDHGLVKYDGNVNDGISIYMGLNQKKNKTYDLSKEIRDESIVSKELLLSKIELINNSNKLDIKEKLSFKLSYYVNKNVDNVAIRFIICRVDKMAVGTCFTETFSIIKSSNEQSKSFIIDTSCLSSGSYYLHIVPYKKIPIGTYRLDNVEATMFFEINQNENKNIEWNDRAWGNYMMPKVEEISDSE